MTDDEERAYIEGGRAAWRSMLSRCLSELGYGDETRQAAAVAQLEEARAALRRVCEDHGDNDWPDELHLADVIEKHLARHLVR